MNILLVIASMGIGGEQRAASTITDYFVNLGNQVHLLTFNASNEKFIQFNDNIEITIAEKSKKNIYRLWSIRSEIKRLTPDVIIGFAVIPSILCSLAALGLGIPVIVCERNDPEVYPALWKKVRRIAYHFASGAVFQTNDASACFDASYFKSRIVIPNPIQSDIKKYRKPFDERKKVIVNTSRLTKAKNQDLIIKAFSRVCNINNEYCLELYGDGECKTSLQKLITDNKLENKVTINNASSDIFNIISQDAIFVLTSSHEGFPNSLAEAMALGLAVISVDCRIGGPKDMINDNINGRLIQSDDENALVDAIVDIIENKEKREYLCINAMTLADTLSIEEIGKKWECYLHKVIDDYARTNKNNC
ncbi:MAG: glycosyltransferase [Saccharofermentans sp.]|nr:glycosyltransferase [Saccharofermentans sp.]